MIAVYILFLPQSNVPSRIIKIDPRNLKHANKFMSVQ